ncbi:MAG: N-formylglutamate amidohydrolase [Balneolaceae bacterium]|nr:N-formylglutamate amidohydrolase [Balneolaceae bacterium]
MEAQLVLTCEHAGNRVPERYTDVFRNDAPVLETHRGYDIGALELTQAIAEACEVEPHLHTVTRLLVDLNRSLHNPTAFSEYVRDFEQEDRSELVRRYYHPHRNRVEEIIRSLLARGEQVLHLSVHTFTPVMRGEERQADAGLLFDPSRALEKDFCRAWKASILRKRPELRVRYNYPYRGTMDGFSTALRRRYGPAEYMGVELEVNQKFPQQGDPAGWKKLREDMGQSLKEALRNELDS